MFGSHLSKMETAGRQLALSFAEDALSGMDREEFRRVLDVGCGSGTLLRSLVMRDSGLDAVGVDPYGADRRQDGIRFLRLGAERLGEMLDRFDLVISSMSLHHFMDVPSFFQRAHSLLRWQTGRLLILDWKQGVDTGIDETYFSCNWVAKQLKSSGWSIVRRAEARWHFAILARPDRFRFAVALGEDGWVADGMLGKAPRFAVFDCEGGRIEQVGVRDNPYAQTSQHLKTLDVARFLSDASLFVARRIGTRGRDRIRARGIRMLLVGRRLRLAELIGFLTARLESGETFSAAGDMGGRGEFDVKFV